MQQLSDDQQKRLIVFCQKLIDQGAATVLVPPTEPGSGFWFGGGNMIADDEDSLVVCGRFRDAGDSRTGLQAGTRGRELAIFRLAAGANSCQKIVSLDKQRLSLPESRVLSIEGCALRRAEDGRVSLFVSTERDGCPYPAALRAHQKPGTGVWSIQRLSADSVAALSDAEVVPWLSSTDPMHLHVKDPFIWERKGAADRIGICTHPFSWSSSNTGYAAVDDPTDVVFAAFPRGPAWDVAMSRGTAVMAVPRVGHFADSAFSILFYDGGECLRSHDEHETAVRRPRGYSCEELGGAAVFDGDDLSNAQRLSSTAPLFVSPHGTGCSRYVDVCVTADEYIATWQQAQPDGSQPLMIHRVDRAELEAVLT